VVSAAQKRGTGSVKVGERRNVLWGKTGHKFFFALRIYLTPFLNIIKSGGKQT
jgi:hypothetical protein